MVLLKRCCVAAEIGTLEKKWAADDSQQSILELDEVAQRMTAVDEMLRASMAPLAAKIEQTAKTAETAAGIFQIVVAMFCSWVSFRWAWCRAVLHRSASPNKLCDRLLGPSGPDTHVS